jgi:hypothetical protein
MQDKTAIGNNENTNTPSEAFREYIESLVEEIVLNNAVFNAHKKYLQRYSQEEGLDYTELEKNLENFFDTLKELKSHKSNPLLLFAKMLAKDCYLEEDKVDKLLTAMNEAREKEEAKHKAKEKKAEEERIAAEKKAEEKRIAREKAERDAAKEAKRKAEEEARRRSAEEAERNKLPLRIENGVVYCTDQKYTGSIEIPEFINGERVTAIGDNAFYYCDCNSVTIPNTVLQIGENAFDLCQNLSEIRIPDSVNTIGPYAFSSCIKLVQITLSQSITHISPGTFSMCPFRRIQIPNSVRFINAYAFSNCHYLEEIVIPANVQQIVQTAFLDCPSLKKVTLMSRNTIFENDTFGNDVFVTYM